MNPAPRDEVWVDAAAFARAMRRWALDLRDVTLVVQWDGKSTRHPLRAGTDRAAAELSAGEGTLDIWIESPEGKRLPFTDNDSSGDAILERV